MKKKVQLNANIKYQPANMLLKISLLHMVILYMYMYMYIYTLYVTKVTGPLSCYPKQEEAKKYIYFFNFYVLFISFPDR